MDDVQVGRICRALRHRLRWRQVDLAARVGCHQTAISRLERGGLAELSIETARKVFASLGARFEHLVRWRAGNLDRLLDQAHATLVEAAARVYQARGWTTIPEVTFSEYGERGSIDLFAVYPTRRIVAVNEMKTDVPRVEETNRVHDVKVRLASKICLERFGWRPVAVARILVVPGDRTLRRTIDRHSVTFRSLYPLDSREIRAWIRDPKGAAAGIWFLSDKREARGGQRCRGRKRIRVAASSTPRAQTSSDGGADRA